MGRPYIFQKRPGSSGGGGGGGGLDTSDYRTTTYGAPDYYCDCTKSLGSSGTGTLGNPWNMNQAMANPVAGDVVGWLPVGAGTPVDLATTNDDNVPAFNPANSGTSGNPIVHVTKYAAIGLVGRDGRATIASNTSRSEMRHDGVAPTIVGGVGAGNGCAIMGSNSRNYITYDGFFTDMSQAYMKEDSGVLRVEGGTGVKFLNYVIKGATLTVASNPIIYRPNGATNCTHTNFLAYDFVNDSTGSATPQGALFSDQYGDVNFTMEYFWVDGIATGPFCKGTNGGTFNYGTYQYGIVSTCETGFRFNDLDATNTTTIHHCLVYSYSSAGITLSGETTDVRRFLSHHNTLAKGVGTDSNQHGPWYWKPLGTNIEIRDNICDLGAGSFGHMIDGSETSVLPTTLNYQGYYAGGDTPTWAFNGVEYNTIANWRSATSRDANSQVLASDPFVNRASNNFTITGGSAALTASSTGGEIGCYEGSINPGVYGSY